MVHKIEQLKTDVHDRPIKAVYIEDCGLLPTEPFTISDEPYEYVNLLYVINKIDNSTPLF